MTKKAYILRIVTEQEIVPSKDFNMRKNKATLILSLNIISLQHYISIYWVRIQTENHRSTRIHLFKKRSQASQASATSLVPPFPPFIILSHQSLRVQNKPYFSQSLNGSNRNPKPSFQRARGAGFEHVFGE